MEEGIGGDARKGTGLNKSQRNLINETEIIF